MAPQQPPSRSSFFLDIRTGEKTPLAESLDGGLYTVSPDGTRLAYVATGDLGKSQIFVAGVDGSGVFELTHDVSGATWPAWSPDGTMITYGGYGSGVFVLDVDTGRTRQIAEDFGHLGLQFTPDGSSIVYTADRITPEGRRQRMLRAVPVDGGKSRPMIGPSGGLTDVQNGSLSPDGSLVTFLGSTPLCGPCRFVANADGTERRIISNCTSNPAGTWSPDGSRIVCVEAGVNGDGRIMVVDMATGDATRVGGGQGGDLARRPHAARRGLTTPMRGGR